MVDDNQNDWGRDITNRKTWILLSNLPHYTKFTWWSHSKCKMLIFTRPTHAVRSHIRIHDSWKLIDYVIKWKHIPRHWPFVRGIQRSPVNSPHKAQWFGDLMFSMIWINGWINNCEAGDVRHHRAHYDVIGMCHRCHPSYWYDLGIFLSKNADSHVSRMHRIDCIIYISMVIKRTRLGGPGRGLW